MALQTLTAVGECIDGQAGAVHTSTVKEEGKDGRALGRGDKNGGRVMEGIGKRWASGLTSFSSLSPASPLSPSLLPLSRLPSLPGFCFEGWGVCCVCVTTKQLELTYFQDRGHWSFGHRGAQSSLPRTHR